MASLLFVALGDTLVAFFAVFVGVHIGSAGLAACVLVFRFFLGFLFAARVMGKGGLGAYGKQGGSHSCGK